MYGVFGLRSLYHFVSHNHGNPDQAKLSDIYNRVTKGRAAGLFARLAQALAGAESLKEMSEIASKPAEDILPYAEQRRFARVSEGSRSAAEKLVCFALPFRRKDAEEIFQEDNVGSAVRELMTLGLLRPHDADSFEMHETVRAGLEGTSPLSVRHSAHEALAQACSGGRGWSPRKFFTLRKLRCPMRRRPRPRSLSFRESVGRRWLHM